MARYVKTFLQGKILSQFTIESTHVGGSAWEKRHSIFYIYPNRCRQRICVIVTSSAQCCGWNTIESISHHFFENSQEIKEAFWKFIQEQFPKDKRGVCTFYVGQLMYMNSLNGKNFGLLETVPHTIVGKWQSASEPGHETYIYSLNFHEV